MGGRPQARRAKENPEKRAAKRARQRAAGYRGVKRRKRSALDSHNHGRDSDLGAVGRGKLDGCE